MKESNRPEWIKSLGLLSVIVADLLGYTGAGVGIGYLAWAKWGAPWWVLVLTSMTGLALAMYRLYKMSRITEGSDRK